MSRSTQFIGLTANAQMYVQDLEEIDSITHSHGIAGEELPLRQWKAPKEVTHVDYPTFITEIVQEVPWSSGPMIFTCLRLDTMFSEGADPGEFDVRFHEWNHDPAIRDQQFDHEKGILWI